ncbi:PLP-dependent decarboxylase [Thalassotalea profundi]|uniref:Diaminopimelate decarboxylase n=1 Tax=Thalassotalea profundi TaxID=2036687 RepID=A0ABQ3ISE4_9GAMM|nr:PLP-dependent decarboxylase [Thalassotalea profundi]GHE93226.1 diaminopimelate decarboxylase [Thalassotalea profundi]
MSDYANWLTPELQQTLLSHQGNNPDEQAYFIYQLDELKKHLLTLQEQNVIKLWYAVKANPLSRIIQTLDSSGFNFDVASSGELKQVLAQGIEPKRILNTGPAKSLSQLTEFLTEGVEIFVVESLNQLNWLQQAAKSLNKCPKVLLRVQLQWQEGEKNPLGGNSLTPFGLSIAEWQGIHIEQYPHLDLCGLHIFQWGNMLSNEKMYSLWQQMVTPLVDLAQSIGMELKILDLGGGLGVDYLEEGQVLSWPQIISDLAKIKAQASVEELWLELGRYAVAHCGFYVVPVIDRKVNYQQEQLVLAAGINHLIRPAITDQPFPVRLLRESQAENINFDIHGPLCTSMDKLGHLPLPDDVTVGDELIFAFAGAYGFTESMPFFLCHQTAAEYVIENGLMTEVRTAQPASWYLA